MMSLARIVLPVALLAALCPACIRAERSLRYDGEQRALDFMALTCASENGNIVLVRGLLDRGVGPNRPRFSSKTAAQYLASEAFGTPLEAAARAGYLDIVELLLARDADPNAQCGSGETALWQAAAAGHAAVVRVLLAHGANPRLFPLPLDVAKERGHADVVALLEAALK
jgi:ankyrin repeat protein